MLDRTVACLILIATVFFVIFYVGTALFSFAAINDLPQYYAAASLAASGHAGDIYKVNGIGDAKVKDLSASNVKTVDRRSYRLFEAEHRFFPAMGVRNGVMLFLPPFAVPLLIPLTWVSPDRIPVVWTFALASTLLVSLLILLRILFPTSLTRTCWTIALVLLSGPALDSLRIGQLAPVLLLGVCLFTLSQRYHAPVLSGLALSLFVLKPQQLIPIAVYMIGARKFRELFWLALFVTICLIISLLMFGMSGFVDYIELLRSPGSLFMMSPQLMPTVRGQLLRFEQTADFATAIGVIAMSLSAIAVFLLGNRLRNSSRWLQLGLIGVMPIGFVCSLHCHNYDLLLLVPGLVALVHTDLWRKVSVFAKTVLMAELVAFLTPFYQEIYYGHIAVGSLGGLRFNPLFVILFVFSLWAFRFAWNQAAVDGGIVASKSDRDSDTELG